VAVSNQPINHFIQNLRKDSENLTPGSGQTHTP